MKGLLKYLPACLLAVIPITSYAVVRISNMNDFNFGTWSGTGNLVATDGICIYDSVNNNYRLTARGSGAGNAFTLANGANTLAYGVQYTATMGGIRTLTANVRSPVLRAANTTSTTCGGGTNGTLTITITQANMLAADAGTYTGVLTILLEP